MSPTFNNGDWLFVHWINASTQKLQPGVIAVVEREEYPGIFLIKRIQKMHAGQFWVQGDSEITTDSRTWGWLSSNEIIGRVLFRYKPVLSLTRKSLKH